MYVHRGLFDVYVGWSTKVETGGGRGNRRSRWSFRDRSLGFSAVSGIVGRTPRQKQKIQTHFLFFVENSRLSPRTLLRNIRNKKKTIKIRVEFERGDLVGISTSHVLNLTIDNHVLFGCALSSYFSSIFLRQDHRPVNDRGRKNN